MSSESLRIKIHVHDFAGHPFQAELSNELAFVGFDILHSFFAHSGPTKASLTDIHGTGRLTFKAISLRQKYENKNLLKRIVFEFKIAFKLLEIHRSFEPQVSIFANTPLISAWLFKLFTRKSKFILWHQDVFSIAIQMRSKQNSSNSNTLENLQVKLVKALEIDLVGKAEKIVCISDAFMEIYKVWGVDLRKVTMIENWAPLNQIVYVPRSRQIDTGQSLIYAGTLGLKHNPQILIDLVRGLNSLGLNPSLTIISEGDGANFISESIESSDPISLRGFVELNELNDLLAESNIAIMLLEEGASEFSVPSKTYSYLAAGKFIVAFAPLSNAASKAVLDAGGLVFDPSSTGVEQAVQEIMKLDFESIKTHELEARNYALDNFQVGKKAELFSRIIMEISN